MCFTPSFSIPVHVLYMMHFKRMSRHSTFEVSLCDGLQSVSLQQQQRQVVQVLESHGANAADVIVGQSQLLQSSRESGGN